MQCVPPPPPPQKKKKKKKKKRRRRLYLLQSREKKKKKGRGKKGLQSREDAMSAGKKGNLPTAVVKMQCQLKEKNLPLAKSSRCSVNRKFFLYLKIIFFISDFCKVVKLNAIPAENLLDFDCCKVVKLHALSTENI